MTESIFNKVRAMLKKLSANDTDENFYKFTGVELHKTLLPTMPSLRYKYLDRIIKIMRDKREIVIIGKARTTKIPQGAFQYRVNKDGNVSGISDNLVSAARARNHIIGLSKCSIGRRAIAECTDIDESIIMHIKNGTHKRIRESTHNKIMAVNETMLSDHALIDSTETLAKIKELLEIGYQKKQLAEILGMANKKLRISRNNKITVKKAEIISRLYMKLIKEKSPDETKTHTGAILTFERKGNVNIITHRMAA